MIYCFFSLKKIGSQLYYQDNKYTIIIDGELWNFKRNHKPLCYFPEYILGKIVSSNNKFAIINIGEFFGNVSFLSNEADRIQDRDIINNLKEISLKNKEIYMIAEKDKLVVETNYCEVIRYKDDFINWKHLSILSFK